MRRLIFGVLFVVLLFGGFWFARDQINSDGTYDELGTADSADGSADALTWDQGNGFIIDEFGKYIILTQNRVNTVTHWAWSNNNGDTWTQGSEDYQFLTRGSIAYDSNNDKLHVIWSATDSNDGIIYRRYGITRDGSNNITAIAREDAGNVNLQLDVSGSCEFQHPTGIWVDNGTANGILVAIWNKNCSGDPQVRGSMRALSLTAADGVAGNWDAPDGTPDSFPSEPPNVDADKIFDGSGGTVGSSSTIRGGSGARQDDLYVFTQTNTVNSSDAVNAYRAVWSSGSNNWSGGWQTPVVVGNASSVDGYDLKQQLISKVILDSANDRLYVGWARWKAGGEGDTVSFAYLNSTDVASSTFDAYSANGTASYAPTLGAAFDATLGNFIIAYIESTTNGDNGSIDWKTFDGTTLSNSTRFYTSPGGSAGANGSADIPVLYPSRVNDRLLFLYRVNGALPPTAQDPHTIMFGFEILATPTPTPTPTPTNTPTPTPSSGGGSGASGPQGSTTNPPVCTNQAPASAPDLYAAVPQSGGSVLLYFSDAQSPVDHYSLTYGDASNDYSWGVDNIGGQGSRTYLVGGLSLGTTYYFRVRGGNGCAPGAWSNEISSALSVGGIIDNSLSITKSELSVNQKDSDRELESVEESESTGHKLLIKVEDTQGKAVAGAMVTVHSDPQTARTDEEGIAEFTGLAAGAHKVQIVYDGYRGEQSIYLSGEQESYNLDITIEKGNSYETLTWGMICGILLCVFMFVCYRLFYRRRKSKMKKI